MISTSRYIQFVTLALGFLALFLLLRWLLNSAVDVLLLIFAGILFAVFVRGLRSFLFSRLERLPEKVGTAITLLILIGAFSAFVILLAPQLAEQLPKLLEEMPKALATVQEKTGGFHQLSELVQTDEGAPPAFVENLSTKVLGVFATTFGVITSLFVIFFVGVYLCFAPCYYRDGIFTLMPLSWHERAKQVFQALDYTLSHWLIGRFAGMLLVSVSSYIGLLLLEVPLPMSLAVLAGLLTFIPNLGPIISAIPAVLLGYMESPSTALYVVLLYLGIQAVESYIVTPLIQQREISLPPVLTLTSQILFVNIFGFLGLLLATPITATVLVLVKMLYIEDVLGKSTDINGSDE